MMIMAKVLTFSIGGIEYTADPGKIDRKKLYGYREQIALDEDGEECQLVSMSLCGTIVIPKGGTALGYLDSDGSWVERSSMRTVKLDGSAAILTPSSYSVVIPLLQKAAPEELLDCSVAAFYRLDASMGLAEAIGSDIYRFEYCYSESYETQTAFVMMSEASGFKELFMLIGRKNEFPFIGLEEITVFDENSTEDDEDDGDEIDFSMF
jgi:hypothetical protein